MPVVAFDDVMFQRHGTHAIFRAPMGIAVTIKDEKEFAKNYDIILDQLFTKYKAERKKRIYKAAHLTAQILEQSTDFIENFIAQISKYIQSVDVYYSYFPGDIVPRFWVFRETHPRYYAPDAFISLIQNSYVHIAVWRYLILHPDCSGYECHVDHFQGKNTPAWEEIRDKQNMFLYNSGGECNCYIATADIFLRRIYDKLTGALVRRSVRQCFEGITNGTHIDAYWLGPKKEFLNAIAPNKDIDINTYPKIKHPLFIIAYQGPSGRASDKDTFEWQNNYSKIMEKAYENKGCVRYWDPAKGPHFTNETQDTVMVANEAAEPIVESIKAIFPNIKIDESLKQ
jgi:hypothetical protein